MLYKLLLFSFICSLHEYNHQRIRSVFKLNKNPTRWSVLLYVPACFILQIAHWNCLLCSVSESSFNFSSTLLVFLLTLKFILLIIRSNNCIWFDKKKGSLKVVKSWLHVLISGLVEQSSWTTSKIKSKADIQLLKLWSTLRENSQLADTNKVPAQLIKFKSVAFTWGRGRGGTVGLCGEINHLFQN